MNEEQLMNLVMATNKLPRDTPFDVYFSDKKLSRTMPQNRYLWGVVYYTISQITGYELEEVHEICKAKFTLRTEFKIPENLRHKLLDNSNADVHEIFEFNMSTRLMDTRQMTDYIDKIRRWASELGIYVPQPGEITDEKFIQSLDYI